MTATAIGAQPAKSSRACRRRARAADRRAHGAQFPAADVRHRDGDAPVRRRARRRASRSSTRARRRRRSERSRSTRCARRRHQSSRRLDEAILIKDNHIRLAGGVAEAIKRHAGRGAGDADRGRGAEPGRGGCRDRRRRRRDPARQLVDRRDPRGRCAHRAGAPRSRCPAASRSIGLPELAATGADYVSIGALTHSAPAADISFELEPDA